MTEHRRVLTATDSPLVAGARGAAPMKTIQIEVTRAFLLAGKRQEVGTRLELDLVLASELISLNKAVRTAAVQPVVTSGGTTPAETPKPAAKPAAKPTKTEP